MPRIDVHTEERSRLKYLLAREELRNMMSSANANKLLSNAHVMLNAIASGQYQYILEQTPEYIYNDMMIAVLEITCSAFGFVGQIEQRGDKKNLALRFHAFTGLPWSEELSLPSALLQEDGQLYLTDLPERGLADLVQQKTFLIENQPPASEKKLDFIPGTPKIKRYVLIPLMSGAKVVGLVGLMNRETPYNEEEITFLQPLLRSMANLMRTHAMECEKKKAELQLAEREKLLHKFISSAPTAIAMLDRDLNYIMASKRWISTFQLGAKNIVARSFFQLHPTLQESLAALMPTVLAGHRQVQEVVTVMQNGEMRWLTWVLEPWFSAAGKQGGIIIFVEDMTHEKKALIQQTKLIEQLKQTNKELSLFTQFCTHDLKEPLRTISSFAQILKRNGSDPQLQKQYLELIMESSKRMNNLVNDMLHFTTLGEQEITYGTVSLPELMRQIKVDLAGLIQEKGGDIVYNKLPTIQGDETLLRQLFQNLISNGLKFNESKKPVVKLSATAHNAVQEILVQDNGIGIDANYYTQIFSMFKRIHGKEYGGSGIGLAICQKIMKLHGGDISLESEVGQGSTFRLIFPLKSA